MLHQSKIFPALRAVVSTSTSIAAAAHHPTEVSGQLVRLTEVVDVTSEEVGAVYASSGCGSQLNLLKADDSSEWESDFGGTAGEIQTIGHSLDI